MKVPFGNSKICAASIGDECVLLYTPHRFCVCCLDDLYKQENQAWLTGEVTAANGRYVGLRSGFVVDTKRRQIPVSDCSVIAFGWYKQFLFALDIDGNLALIQDMQLLTIIPSYKTSPIAQVFCDDICLSVRYQDGTYFSTTLLPDCKETPIISSSQIEMMSRLQDLEFSHVSHRPQVLNDIMVHFSGVSAALASTINGDTDLHSLSSKDIPLLTQALVSSSRKVRTAAIVLLDAILPSIAIDHALEDELSQQVVAARRNQTVPQIDSVASCYIAELASSVETSTLKQLIQLLNSETQEKQQAARSALITLSSPKMATQLGSILADQESLLFKKASIAIVTRIALKKPVSLYCALPIIVQHIVSWLAPEDKITRSSVIKLIGNLLSTLVQAFPTISFSALTQSLAVARSDGHISIYDIRTGTRTTMLLAHDTHPVSACSISPDGLRLVSISLADGKLKVWRMPTAASTVFQILNPFGSASSLIKELAFNLGLEGHMTVQAQLEWIVFEWKDRRVRCSIRETVLGLTV